MRSQMKIPRLLTLALVSMVMLFSSCDLNNKKPVHDRVYRELLSAKLEKFPLNKIRATSDTSSQLRLPNVRYLNITSEGMDLITVSSDSTPPPCPPGKPCFRMIVENNAALFSRRDSVLFVTGFRADTSFQRDNFNVEVMESSLPQRVEGSLLYVNKILPGERYYIMKIAPR